MYCNLDPDLSWIKIMYPVIFNILKEKKFKRCVEASFQIDDMGSEIMRYMKNFISQCLNINLQNRPTIDETLKHWLLESFLEFKVKKNDVWKVKTSQQTLNF